MKKTSNAYLFILLATIGLQPTFAENPNIKQAEQHLKDASDKVSSGDLSGASEHIQKAKQYEIMHEAERPLHTNPADKAEQVRREHADKIFQNINQAKSAASRGNPAEAGSSLGEAEKHLKRHK